MKIAAIADIHGNYQALIATIDHINRWAPDKVMVLGDIINRGPRSLDCLNLVQEKALTENWMLMKGNHEGYVLNFLDPGLVLHGIEHELRKVSYWTYQSLADDDIEAIVKLPEMLDLVIQENQIVRGLHASTAGDRVGIYPDASSEELENLVDCNVNAFLVGHTHQPFIKLFQGTLLINAGSVGLPFDGDKRASYAQITYNKNKWSAEIIRLEYDLPAAVQDFSRSGFLAEGGPIAELILGELKLGWPQLSSWFTKYETRVLRKEIKLEQAVADYLQNPHLEMVKSDVPMIYPEVVD